MDIHERVCRYMVSVPPAISGHGGHNQTFSLACALYNGFGLDESQVLEYLRLYNEKCQPPWSESELIHKARSAANATHSKERGHLIGNNGFTPSDYRYTSFEKPEKKIEEPEKVFIDPATLIENFLDGERYTESDLFEASPIKPSDDFARDGILLVENLFKPGELINFVTDFKISLNKDKTEKAIPHGYGSTIERDNLAAEWEFGMPQSKAGGWMRMNPMDGKGIADKNVTSFRHILLEFDSMPLDLQLSLFHKLNLPIAAILTSGGKSVHAWVRSNAIDETAYRDDSNMLLEMLGCFGLDKKNKNPSRLSRLPGVIREIGGAGDNRQRLLYLNPKPGSGIDFKQLAADLKPIHDMLKPKAKVEPAKTQPQQDGPPDSYYDEQSSDNKEKGFETVVDLPPIVDSAKFQAEEYQQPDELVKGLIHKGTKVIIGGGSKSFKTWSQFDLAISVAYGLDWMGFECTPGRVLFINFEIQPYFFQKRLTAILEAKGLQPVEGRLDIWNLRGFSANYRIILPQIIKRIKELGYSLIVIDPVYKIYGNTDENSASEVSQLLNHMEQITVETGATILFGAHYSKGNQAGKESIDRISGSGVFARDPDSIINFTKHENEGSFVVECTLRNLPPIQPFVVTWNYPLFSRDEDLSPDDLKQVGRPAKHSADDLYDLLPDEGLSNEEWQESAKGQGMSRSVFFRLKAELQRNDMVIHSKIDSTWKPCRK